MKQLFVIIFIGFCLNVTCQLFSDLTIVETRGAWVKYENGIWYNYWTDMYIDSSMYNDDVYPFEIIEVKYDTLNK